MKVFFTLARLFCKPGLQEVRYRPQGPLRRFPRPGLPRLRSQVPVLRLPLLGFCLSSTPSSWGVTLGLASTSSVGPEGFSGILRPDTSLWPELSSPSPSFHNPHPVPGQSVRRRSTAQPLRPSLLFPSLQGGRRCRSSPEGVEWGGTLGNSGW